MEAEELARVVYSNSTLFFSLSFSVCYSFVILSSYVTNMDGLRVSNKAVLYGTEQNIPGLGIHNNPLLTGSIHHRLSQIASPVSTNKQTASFFRQCACPFLRQLQITLIP